MFLRCHFENFETAFNRYIWPQKLHGFILKGPEAHMLFTDSV